MVSRNRFRIATQAFKILFGSNAFPRRFRSACSCAGCTTSWFSINRRIIFTDSACLATRCWGLRLFRLRLRSGCARSSFSIYRRILFTDSISLGARCFLTSWSCWRLFIASFERLICFWKFRKVRPGNWSCRQFSSFWRKAFFIYLSLTEFEARTASYGPSFSPLRLMIQAQSAWAINRRGKNQDP